MSRERRGNMNGVLLSVRALSAGYGEMSVLHDVSI